MLSLSWLFFTSKNMWRSAYYEVSSELQSPNKGKQSSLVKGQLTFLFLDHSSRVYVYGHRVSKLLDKGNRGSGGELQGRKRSMTEKGKQAG